MSEPSGTISGSCSRSIARLSPSYALAISHNHPLVDGNKRTSLVIAELFLQLNDFVPTVTDEQSFSAFLQLAAGELTEQQLADWITARSGIP